MAVKLKLILLLLFAIGTSSPACADESISGLWSSVARTKGGLGRQWQFSTNGNATATFGAVVNFHYEVQGDKLRMRLAGSSADPSAEESVQSYNLHGDELIIRPANAKERQVMKRVGIARKGTDPIVGEWEFKHYTGGMATFRYGRNKNALLSVPMQSATGAYRVQGNMLSVRFPGKPQYFRRIRQTDGRLILLATTKEPEEVYERAPE